ncbi:zinc-binding dehydrogenase [Pleomorphomonas koreensis]|uniref:zinc-binding dehydrogenase n=1 Tax=Pleomorphomonas koreensis TaxID=257440 RepID=UPI00041E4692|nr:alcohol dehydrogenase catalytic domain-containing protein [Pleomorphomonas koreensis]
MKAAVVHAPGDLRVEEIATPLPAAGEVRIRVARCGVCGSDIPRIVKTGAHFYPIVVGHEFSGRIDAVGEGVDAALVGRQAACVPLIPNFDHPQSALGNFSLGKGYDFIGSRRQGGLAEYVTMPAGNAFLMPDSVDPAAAAFMEPLTVGLHAVNIMDFRPGRRAALVGAGGIGLLLLQNLKRLGAGSVTVFDVDPPRLETALKLGADRVFDSRAADIETDFDDVFETAGAPAAELLALRIAGPRAHVMFVGTPHVPLTLQPAEFELINRKELTVQGSWMNYSAPFPGWEWQYAAAGLERGDYDIAALIDRVVPLSRADEIVGLLSTPGALKGKLIVDCQS